MVGELVGDLSQEEISRPEMTPIWSDILRVVDGAWCTSGNTVTIGLKISGYS